MENITTIPYFSAVVDKITLGIWWNCITVQLTNGYGYHIIFCISTKGITFGSVEKSLALAPSDEGAGSREERAAD